MLRLFVLDPCLSSVSSHNYSEAVALLSEAREMQLPVRLLCHVDAQAAVRELPAEPHFRQLGYSHMADTRPATDFVTINFCNQSTYEDLRAIRETLTREDFVFFPTVTCNIVQAICRWIGEFAPEDAPRFGMCLMFPPGANTAARPSTVAAQTYRAAFAQLRPELADRVVFTCETESLSRVYEPLIGARPVTLPIRSWAGTSVQTGAATRPPRISFLGGARREKGFHLLPEIIGIIREREPDVRFTVQAVGHQPDLLAGVIGRLAVHRDVVQLLRQPLSSEQLWSALYATSLLLLPYDVESYGKRGSSLFTEARAVGLPMVAPAALTVAAREEFERVAETFEAFDATHIAAAALRALERLDALTDAARREAALFRARDPGYLQALLSRPSSAA